MEIKLGGDDLIEAGAKSLKLLKSKIRGIFLNKILKYFGNISWNVDKSSPALKAESIIGEYKNVPFKILETKEDIYLTFKSSKNFKYYSTQNKICKSFILYSLILEHKNFCHFFNINLKAIKNGKSIKASLLTVILFIFFQSHRPHRRGNLPQTVR